MMPWILLNRSIFENVIIRKSPTLIIRKHFESAFWSAAEVQLTIAGFLKNTHMTHMQPVLNTADTVGNIPQRRQAYCGISKRLPKTDSKIGHRNGQPCIASICEGGARNGVN